MKRNQRTEVRAGAGLAPLTEQILRRMGPEGEAIRARLLAFFQDRLRRPTHSTATRPQEEGRERKGRGHEGQGIT